MIETLLGTRKICHVRKELFNVLMSPNAKGNKHAGQSGSK